MAWVIAIIAASICSLAILAFLVAMLMRTEPEPVVLRVDNSTGATTMLRSMRDDQDKYDEVINKYWLAQYVRTCEHYDWYSINEAFEACKLMSDDPVARQYAIKVQAEHSPLNVLRDTGKIAVQIVSIVFVGDTAQVRFTTQKVNNSGENIDSSPLQKWIATVTFAFKPSLMFTEQQRLVNPLGFRVYSYRVDPEVL